MMEVVQVKSRTNDSRRQEGKVSMRDFPGTVTLTAGMAEKGKFCD
ncbi:MAG: hypothetical protein ACYS67_03770 [Planctomycetota bacterium]